MFYKKVEDDHICIGYCITWLLNLSNDFLAIIKQVSRKIKFVCEQ